ncbi:hypothetical protein J7443_03855 [Tropicibacter sp. R15_0]|uniref:hypothetical protein n=1 Tax=Tropicibacter sp. R15_0 TaxID=2821101 RepID=UPI001ADA04E2|nr:hypothetical protein [Tropicibacter sp. R15_0]MBO9464354.1 hypothetical protein [Tropicibacter sp. R15_0]
MKRLSPAMKAISLIKPKALLLPLLFATATNAQTTLLDAYSACETSVLSGADAALREIGLLLDEDERGSRLQIETPKGSLLAMFIPPNRGITACIFWGREPKLAIEFQDRWTDWVEWEEASSASDKWFENAMVVSGSVDLTDPSKPGHVVARCNSLKHCVVLSSQL